MKKLTDYGGAFLKADNVMSETDEFEVTDVKEVEELLGFKS